MACRFFWESKDRLLIAKMYERKSAALTCNTSGVPTCTEGSGVDLRCRQWSSRRRKVLRSPKTTVAFHHAARDIYSRQWYINTTLKNSQEFVLLERSYNGYNTLDRSQAHLQQHEIASHLALDVAKHQTIQRLQVLTKYGLDLTALLGVCDGATHRLS